MITLSNQPPGRLRSEGARFDIYTLNADGSDPVQLTDEVAPNLAQMPVGSPDGRYIAFMSFREGYCSVFQMNSDRTDLRQLTSDGASGEPRAR
jgi:Tol biopolymer transport system component